MCVPPRKNAILWRTENNTTYEIIGWEPIFATPLEKKRLQQIAAWRLPSRNSIQHAVFFENKRIIRVVCVPPKENAIFWRAENIAKYDGNAWERIFATPLEENHLQANRPSRKTTLARDRRRKAAARRRRMRPTEEKTPILDGTKTVQNSMKTSRAPFLQHP